MKFSYIVPIVAVVYFGLHVLAYYLTPLFIQGVNMIDYEIIIKVDGVELDHSVLHDLTYQSIYEDIIEYFEKIKDDE